MPKNGETSFFGKTYQKIVFVSDENLCATNPCKNGGTCQRLGGDFYCECGAGFAGRYCENSEFSFRYLKHNKGVNSVSYFFFPFSVIIYQMESACQYSIRMTND